MFIIDRRLDVQLTPDSERREDARVLQAQVPEADAREAEHKPRRLTGHPAPPTTPVAGIPPRDLTDLACQVKQRPGRLRPSVGHLHERVGGAKEPVAQGQVRVSSVTVLPELVAQTVEALALVLVLEYADKAGKTVTP